MQTKKFKAAPQEYTRSPMCWGKHRSGEQVVWLKWFRGKRGWVELESHGWVTGHTSWEFRERGPTWMSTAGEDRSKDDLSKLNGRGGAGWVLDCTGWCFRKQEWAGALQLLPPGPSSGRFSLVPVSCGETVSCQVNPPRLSAEQ